MSFTQEHALRSSVESTSNFPFGTQEWGKKGNGTIYAVLTKAGVGHPTDADGNQGYIALKRTVLYKHGNITRAEASKVIVQCAPCVLCSHCH